MKKVKNDAYDVIKSLKHGPKQNKEQTPPPFSSRLGTGNGGVNNISLLFQSAQNLVIYCFY